MIDQSQVTVIIPHLGVTKEQQYALDQCLISLLETCTCKIIIAKNGSSTIPYHGTEDRVCGVVVEEQGQCRAVNAAVATVNTPWILVTNDDMVYAPGWFEKLVAPLANDILCISPKLIEPRSGAPTFEVYPCGGAGGDFDKVKWLEFTKDYDQGRMVMSDNGVRKGFNLPFLISRELFNLIEQYDINYDPFSSNSDSDLEYKIRLAGVQPYQNTNCIVYHFAETSGTSHPDNRPYWEKNWHYFIDKWGFERASSPSIWEASFEIPMDKLKYKPDWAGKYA